jgi:hypothetical protein
MSVTRGFPHLSLIREALRVLIPRLRRGELPAIRRAPWQGWKDYRVAEAAVSAQHLARSICEVYGLSVGTVVVTFRSDLEAAGCVEIGPSRDFFVEVQERFRTDARRLAQILGHEVAHIFLREHGIDRPETLANEVLTDTTAAVYGFGALMADSYVVDEQRHQVPGGVQITRREDHLGYLTPDEIGYVLCRGGFADIFDQLRSPAARKAFRVGRRLARRELNSPPLRLAPRWRMLWYRLRRWWSTRFNAQRDLITASRYALSDGRVSFRCPQCTQAIRVPVRRELVASCPTCEQQIPCST